MHTKAFGVVLHARAVVGHHLWQAQLSVLTLYRRVVQDKALHIVGHDGGPIVPLPHPELHVAQGDIVGMAQIEAPGGQLLPHGEFGIAPLPFGYGGQLLGCGAAIGIGAVGMAGID